jgi:hypothetical protein
MDFLNHREGGVVLYRYFLLSSLQCIYVSFSSFLLYSVHIVVHYRNCKRLREFEEIEISMQSCRGDSEQQGGKFLRLLSGFRPRIRPLEGATLACGRGGGWGTQFRRRDRNSGNPPTSPTPAKNCNLASFVTDQPRNLFRFNSANLCSLAGRYDNPFPTMFL